MSIRFLFFQVSKSSTTIDVDTQSQSKISLEKSESFSPSNGRSVPFTPKSVPCKRGFGLHSETHCNHLSSIPNKTVACAQASHDQIVGTSPRGTKIFSSNEKIAQKQRIRILYHSFAVVRVSIPWTVFLFHLPLLNATQKRLKRQILDDRRFLPMPRVHLSRKSLSIKSSSFDLERASQPDIFLHSLRRSSR